MAEVVDLVPLILWAVAFSILWLLASLAKKIHATVSGLPWPLDTLARPVTDVIGVVASALTDATGYSEAQVAKWFHGVADFFFLLLALPVLLAEGIYKALQYAWDTALDPRIHIITNPLRTVAHSANAKVDALAGMVANNVTSSERYARGQATGALSDAKAWARTEIDTAKAAATSYADDAVAKLRRAEDTAIGDAISIATAAKTAATEAVAAAERYTREQLAAAHTALTTLIDTAKAAAEHTAADALATARSDLGAAIDAARSDLGSTLDTVRTGAAAAVADAVTKAQAAVDALSTNTSAAITEARTAASGAVTALSDSARDWASTAEQDAESIAAAADAALDKALATVRATAVGAATDLNDLVGPEGLIGAAALIASIPALATLVHAIADEAGLGRAECRGKVRGVCTTDPAAWATLLAGIAVAGLTFDLADMAEAAGTIATDAHELVHELTAGVMGEAPRIGAAIGAVANSIAQAA